MTTDTLLIADRPQLIQTGTTGTLLAVQTLDAAEAIVRAGTEHAVIAWTDAGQLKRALQVTAPAARALVLPELDEDPATHRGAFNLAQAATQALASLAPVVLTVPAPALGWTFHLDAVTTDGAVEAQLARAAKLRSRPPARAQEAGTAAASHVPQLDLDRGRLVYSPFPTEAPSVLLTAAPEVARVVHVLDDVYAKEEIVTTLVDLRVHVGPADDREVVDVVGQDLAQIGRLGWLRRGPLVTVTREPGPRTGELIENSIRHQAGEAPTHRVLNRLGWYGGLGRPVWLHADGYIDATGNHRRDEDPEVETWAQLRGEPASISLPTCSDSAAALRHEWEAWQVAPNRALRATLIGLTRASLAGLGHAGAGKGLEVVVHLLAQHGSGKTTLLSLLNAGLSSRWASRPMAKVDGTSASKRRLAVEHEDVWVTVDDARERKSVRVSEAQDEVIEELVRRGFERGAGSTKSEKDENGEWHAGAAPETAPAVIIAGEVVPDAQDVASTVDRLVIAELPWQQVDRSKVADAVASPLLQEAVTAFLTHVAAAAIGTGPDAWTAYLQSEGEAVDAIAERLAARLSNHRAARSNAMILRGYALWLDALTHHDVLSADEAGAERDAAEEELIAQSLRTRAVHLETAQQSILERILGAVATGRLAAVGDPIAGVTHQTRGHAPVVAAAITTRDGEQYVLINHSVAADALGLSAKQVLTGLADVRIPGPDGKPTVSRRWFAMDDGLVHSTPGKAAVVQIPLTAWETPTDEGGLSTPALAPEDAALAAKETGDTNAF